MSQDRNSGADASRYGREYGRRIAMALGAEMLSCGSNECLLNGDRVSVHCARRGNNSVGVTYETMRRIVAVLGAFERQDGYYNVWRLPIQRFSNNMRPTRSRGRSANKVGLVTRAVFETEGKLVDVVRF